MPLFLKIYLILAAVSIVVRTVGSAKRLGNLDLSGVFIAIAAGAVLGIGYAMLDSSTVSGAYVYKVNGVVVSGGIVNVAEAFCILLMGGAVPSLIGMAIGDGIRKAAERKASGDKSISLLGKVACVFFLIEAGGAIIMAICDIFSGAGNSTMLMAYLFTVLIFLIPGLLLLRKWRKS